jgi:hypothetical protein
MTERKPEPVTSPAVEAGDVAEDGLITVRTSQRPDQDLRVTPAEHLDLEAQGLLIKSSQKDARLRPASGKE